jgi:Ser/Thr protein kinase RdoA (MazF antagonist)
MWGQETTKYFFELTPHRVLQSVEASGLLCTGRCVTLNSFENRVYEVELETEFGKPDLVASRRIVKFYRPGRWSREQILEEHEFLNDLQEAEIPVVAPMKFPDGSTLHSVGESGIFYAIFPKVGGRAPEELTDEQFQRVGRLLARIHAVGVQKKVQFRLQLTPTIYGRSNLEMLLSGGWILPEFRDRYESTVKKFVI